MQNPLNKGLERKLKNIAHFCLFYVEIKMMKVENILYFWLSPSAKVNSANFFSDTKSAKINCAKCAFLRPSIRKN